MKSQLKALERFARRFDTDIEVVSSYTWASDIPNKVIFAGPRLDEKDIDCSMIAYNRLGYNVPVHPNVFAFIHELGHVLSGLSFTEEEIEYLVKEYIVKREELMNDEDLSDDEFLYEYWQLDLEKMANRWAVEYLKSANHKELEEITSLVYNFIGSEEMEEEFQFSKAISELFA